MATTEVQTVGEYFARNPRAFAKSFWPQVTFYDRQHEIIESVRDVKETYVVAGNQLGKDFVAGFIVLWFFLTRTPCRIITTSAKDDHLRVLWSEMNWFIQNAREPLPLVENKGGPLLVNQREIKKYTVDGGLCPISYIRGMVAADDTIAAMGGHHAMPKVPDGLPHSMFVTDESSSVRDACYDVASGWFQRGLFFGNAWNCSNFFKKNYRKGDLRIEM